MKSASVSYSQTQNQYGVRHSHDHIHSQIAPDPDPWCAKAKAKANMIIVHSDNDPLNPSGCGSSNSNKDTPIVLSRKDWVRFDDEDNDKPKQEQNLKHIEIDKDKNHVNLHLDMKQFESVEINFVKRRKWKGARNGQVECIRTKIVTSNVLIKNMEVLKQSTFYYERDEYHAETCSKLLSTTPPGTFLIRDSSDPNYLFTLSLQTDRGPTSVRLIYSSGGFRLDAADERLIGALPGFRNVVQLVQYYVQSNRKRKPERNKTNTKSGNRQVWVDSTTGQTHSIVKLAQPLRHQVPTLKHLSRLALNKLNCDINMLPEPVRKYLNAYPYEL